MRMTSCFFFVLCFSTLFTSAQMTSSKPTTDLAERQQKLAKMFDEEWQYELRTSPEMATAYGDKRYNDRLSDYSAAAQQADMEQRKKFLAQFEAIEPTGLPEQDALSLKLMVRNLRQDLEEAPFKPWELPISQFGGPHTYIIDLVTLTPFESVQDYENYISRLHQIPRVFEQITANMRQGMRIGSCLPRYPAGEGGSADRSNRQGQMSTQARSANRWRNFQPAYPAADQERLRLAVVSAIQSDVIPAYRKLADFMQHDYAPKGRIEPGVWALPDGDARYRFAVRKMTTTNLTPEQIHEIGLKQLAETEGEMLALAHQLGFKDLASLNEHIRSDRSMYASSGQQLFDLYTKYARQMEARLPELFGTLPKNKLIVVPMDEFRAKDAPPADYTPGHRMVRAPDALM